ncbi:MAG: transcription elongation factor GreA [Clostridia bacterium]|nr:transcription elongation factor GreA [Clostridia bacterium]
MENQRILTMTDKANLLKELEELKIAKQEVTEEIKIARGFGDLSENAEYTEAKENEGRIYGRLAELEELLKNSTFVDDSKLTADVVNMGTVVTVYDMEYEEEDEYTIVGFTESDPMKLFISADSPIGAALIGARVGDVVEANTPGGVIKLEVRAIRLR